MVPKITKKKCQKRGYKGVWTKRGEGSCISLEHAGCKWEGNECVLPDTKMPMMDKYLSSDKSERKELRGESEGGGLSSKSRRRIRLLKKNRRSKKSVLIIET